MLEYILNIPSLWISIALIIASLTIAAVTDIKTQKIPILLFPITLALLIAVLKPDMDHICGGILLGVTFLMFALFGNGGGGDVLMMAVVGYQMGVRAALWCGLMSYTCYALFAVGYYITRKKKNRDKKKQFPFAPFAMLGFLIVTGVFLCFP